MNGENPRILVVEDEIIVVQDLQACLVRLGYKPVGWANSGEMAIQMVEEHKPDLVIMDIVLKGEMDGIDVASLVYSRFRIPTVFLTAHSDRATIEKTKGAHAFGYLLKPFGEKDVHACIEIALNKYRHEMLLEESRNWFSQTLASIGDSIIATDEKENITFINPVAQKLTGWTEREALGQHASKILNMVNSETGQPVANPVSQALQEGSPCGLPENTVLVNRNNEHIPIGDSASPIKDQNGHILGAVMIFQNITGRQQADREFRRYASELYRSNRDLQDYAFVASHDLREPLRKVHIFGDRLQTMAQSKLDVKEREYLDRMLNATVRMQQMVDNLLELSKPIDQKNSFVPTDLNRVVETVLSDLEIRLKETQGTVHVDPLPVLEANPTQMYQLFQNLISNGLKFHKDGISPVIRIKARDLENGNWEIRVEDEGVGFAPKDLEQIFKPFEQLGHVRDVEGWGIGGAVCHRIVQSHNGTISADSQPGRGAHFIITLPEKQE